MQSMAPPVAARPPSAPAPAGPRVSFPNNSQDQQHPTTVPFAPPAPGATPLPPPHATLTALPPRAAAAGGHGYGYGYGAYVRPVNAADDGSRRHSDAAAVAVAPPRYPVAPSTPDLAIITAQALDLMRQLERVNAENERLVADVASRVKQVKEVLKIDPTVLADPHPPSSPASAPTAHHLGLSPPVIVADFPPVEPASATTQTSPVAEHAAPLRDMIDVGCEAVLPDVPFAARTARDASAAAFPNTSDQGSSPHSSSETLMPVDPVGHVRHEAVVAEAAMQTDAAPDPRIEALQQDNAALAATLKEYESTLELIMSKFRAQVQAAQDDKKRLHRDLQVHLAAERDRSDQLAREKTQAMEKLDAAQAIMRTSLRLAAEEDRDWAEQVAALQVEVETLRATLDSVQTAAESTTPAAPADKDGTATRPASEENAVGSRDVNASARSVPVISNGSTAALVVPIADPRPASEADVDLAAAMNDDDDGHDVSIPPGLPQFDAGFSAIPAVNVTIARRPASPEVGVDPASVPAPPSPARPSMGLPDVVVPHEPAPPTVVEEVGDERMDAPVAAGPLGEDGSGEHDSAPVPDPESSVAMAGDARSSESDAEGDTSTEGISDSGHSSSVVDADENDESPDLVLKLDV
ncbi:hypothetical protein GGF32_005581 [Allomyces javanicus]|nr:hypothetical protein GGF32_005581 [Allomyces javanicus]